MAGSALAVLWAAAILAVCAMSAAQNVCYTMARSDKVVAAVKTRSRWTGRTWVTVSYTQYSRKYVPKKVATCCPGYRSSSKGSCEPVCDPSCEEPKVCAAPNRCQCPGQLVQDGRGRCVERLCLDRRCEHGSCNPTSGVCVCESGYRWQGDRESGRCLPVCPGGCSGGRCSAPNTCDCGGGFRRAAGGGGCEPASCPTGYELKLNGTLGVRTCQPVCPSGCPNGSCSAPDTCECVAGFQPARRQDGASTCVATPRCWQNGYYAGHDTCRCLPGYRLTQGALGLPTCEPDCGDTCGPHADCMAPNTCTCVRGYRDERSIVELEQNAAIRCVPICMLGCGNGKCVAPNECQCVNSFQWWKFYSCFNASCHAFTSCSCWAGYEPLPGNATICTPHCDPPCGNGTCVSPGRCTCWEGYEVSSRGCVPKCSTNCGYGTCVAPERCECWPGYELATDETGQARCVPACRPPCVHGDCVAPDTCECWRGYQLEQSTCRPVCAQTCSNADCVAPDTCRCWQGFAPAPGGEAGWACQPTCNATCVNATCTAPNTCTCLDGLVCDSGDPTGARCGPPCPDHLCSEGLPGEHGCVAAAEDPDCVCATGRRRGPCEASSTPQGHIAWPLLTLLLIPGLAAVALLAFLHARNRRKKSPAGDVPPQRLSTTTSEGTSPKHSTSDEYDNTSGYYTLRSPADTKKLIRRGEKRCNPNARSSHTESGDPVGRLYEQIGGDRCSLTYGEVAYSEIGGGNVLRDSSKLEPNSAVEDGAQMAENDFYGDPAGSEWCRASVHQVANDLYAQRDSRPQGNTSAQVDLDAMYAKVVKKGDRHSTAKVVNDECSSQPNRNRQENSSVRLTPNDAASAALHHKSAVPQTDRHYEEVSDRFKRPTALRKGRPATQQEDQQYEEIANVCSKQFTEMVDNDLYRDCVSTGFVCQEVDVDYEEIVNEANRGSGEMAENSLYGQR